MRPATSLALAAVITALGIARTTSATVYLAQENVANFGDASQNATDPEGNYLIPSTSGVAGARKGPEACAPTSAVNSFSYLQKEYGINGLVGPNPFDAINELASSTYMKTGDDFPNPNPPPDFIGDANTGTTPQNFLAGKEQYIADNFHPQNGYTAIQTVGQSIYQSQASNGTTQGGVAMMIPTAAFIEQQLAEGEDVEMFFRWSDPSGNELGGGHVVTLTGIDFDSTANSGDLSFIDPFGGSAADSADDITSDNLGVLGGSGYLVFGYGGGAAGNSVDPDNPDSSGYGKVVAVFAESPVPEPMSIGLLSAIAIASLGKRRAGINRR